MSADNDRKEIRKDIQRVCGKLDEFKDDIREDISDLDEKVGDIREKLPGDADLQSKTDCHTRFSTVKLMMAATGGALFAMISGAYYYTYEVSKSVAQLIGKLGQ